MFKYDWHLTVIRRWNKTYRFLIGTSLHTRNRGELQIAEVTHCYTYYNWHIYNIILIVGYALSQVIHPIQSEIYFGNPDWYMEWLGKDRQYPAYHSDLRVPPPLPFLWQPPPPLVIWVWKLWLDNLTVTLTYLAKWEEDGQAIPKSISWWALILRSNRWSVCLDLDWDSLLHCYVSYTRAWSNITSKLGDAEKSHHVK
jgi:hypothetical protein